jgi:hypothetical protein
LTIKFVRDSKLKDEKLRKTLIKYFKSYENFEIIKNKIQEQTEMLEKEVSIGKTGVSIEDLSKQIKVYFITKIEGNLSIIEKADNYKNMTVNLIGKILKKLNDSEAYLTTRTRNMNFLRKENGRIISSMKIIKDQVSIYSFFLFFCFFYFFLILFFEVLILICF